VSLSRSLYIIDYGAEDLHSVQMVFERLGVDVVVGGDPKALRNAPALVLAGVGAFGHMRQLEEKGLVEPLLMRIEAGVPFLGVCLGLQLLFEASEEEQGVKGLGVLRGDVRALPDSVKEPHIGWSRVEACTCSDLFEDIPEGSAFYFAHGYAVVPRSPGDVLAVTDHDGVVFVSAVEAGNVVGVQFHLEESGAVGSRFCRNFARRAGLEAA
jgi:glutamine amidotransferase